MTGKPPCRRLMLVLSATIAVGTTSAGAQVAERSSHPTGWSAVHADAANSDYSPVTGVDDVEIAWSRDFPGMINLGPTTDGMGRLYVTTSGPGCRLHALDRSTGRTLWCSAEPGRQVVASSPLIDGQGRLYLADADAMFAWNRDGRLLWRTPIAGFPLSAVAGREGIVFITNIGVLHVLDPENGRALIEPLPLAGIERFDSREGGLACMRGLPACPSANTPAVDHRTGRIVFTLWTPGAPAAGVRAMRIVPGNPVRVVPEWTNDALPGGTAASPTLSPDGSRVYLTDNAGNLHAIDAETGAIVWSMAIGYASGGSVSLSPEGLIMPAGGRGAALMAIADEGDHGRLVWRDPRLENFGVATQAAGHRAYPTVATGERSADLLVVDTLTGDVLDRETLPGEPFFTVGTTIDADGTIYVATIGGELHAYRPSSR